MIIVPSNVSTLNAGPLTVTATISVGTGCTGLALVGTKLYAAVSAASGTRPVKVIDTTTNTVSKTVNMAAANMSGLIYDGTSKVWASWAAYNYGYVGSISTSTDTSIDNWTFLDNYSYGIGYASPPAIYGSQLVVGSQDINYNYHVNLITMSSGTNTGYAANDVRSYRGEMVDKVFMSPTLVSGKTFSNFDVTNGGNYSGPTGITGESFACLTRFGTRIFAPGYLNPNVYVYTFSGTSTGGGSTSFTLENTITLDSAQIYNTVADTVNGRIYAYSANSSKINVIDASSQTFVGSINIGTPVTKIVGSSDGTTLYAAGRDTGNVYVIQ